MDTVIPSIRICRAVLERVVGRRVTLVVVLVLGTGTTARIVRWVLTWYRLANNRRLKKQHCQEALDTLAAQLNEDSKVSPELRTEILDLSFSDLQARLKTGRLTPVQVLQAFQLQALDAHQKTNCLVEPIVEAKVFASELETKNKNILPLYGIPVSFKDNFGIKDYDSTIGLAKWIDRPFEEDCIIVKVLKEQGAVPFMKTNVPQAMMCVETSNPIFGLTTHPLNKDYTPGGSTGGESALMAGGGSVLGFGSDLVGSIRIPAAFCGICSFKPTQGRLSDKGMFPFMKGQTLMKSSFGPIAKEVDGLVTAMRALLTPLMFQLDNTLPPVPFNEQVFNNKRTLRIGYYTYDGYLKAVPACERAVSEAVEALQRRGHQIVEYDFSKFTSRIMGPVFATMFGDGGQDLLEMLAGDRVDPTLKSATYMLAMGARWKRLLATIIGLPYPNLGCTIRSSCGSSSVHEWWQLAACSQALRQEVIADWREQGLDVVICPGAPCPALPHGLPAKCAGLLSYTAVYNLLNFPVGAVPVSKVTTTDIDQTESYPTPDPWHKVIKQGQSGTNGFPVGIQVAALPWQDELCLRVMKDLESALKHR